MDKGNLASSEQLDLIESVLQELGFAATFCGSREFQRKRSFDYVIA